MITTAQARAFINENGIELSDVGSSVEGWTTVHKAYEWYKHSDVYFTVVSADPDGQLWQYIVRENYSYGCEVDTEAVPVQTVTETKKVVSYVPRLVRKET